MEDFKVCKLEWLYRKRWGIRKNFFSAQASQAEKIIRFIDENKYKSMKPFWNNFKGSVVKVDKNNFDVKDLYIGTCYILLKYVYIMLKDSFLLLMLVTFIY